VSLHNVCFSYEGGFNIAVSRIAAVLTLAPGKCSGSAGWDGRNNIRLNRWKVFAYCTSQFPEIEWVYIEVLANSDDADDRTQKSIELLQAQADKLRDEEYDGEGEEELESNEMPKSEVKLTLIKLEKDLNDQNKRLEDKIEVLNGELRDLVALEELIRKLTV